MHCHVENPYKETENIITIYVKWRPNGAKTHKQREKKTKTENLVSVLSVVEWAANVTEMKYH